MRLTGQDTRRGTFSQRHAVLVDYANGDEFVPLAHLAMAAAHRCRAPSRGGWVFTVRDSLLSEYAAVGFEYGYSVEAPEALVAWEAQFGDFANGAQIIIDNFLVAAEDKWGQHAGLVMLLPHGYEGQGPEHSSARLRAVPLAVRPGQHAGRPSLRPSAQYFHLLRSQALLAPEAPAGRGHAQVHAAGPRPRSPIAELDRGSFADVLDDPASTDPAAVRRIVLCSGKVGPRGLQRRRQLAADAPATAAAVAVVRVEQLYPWPTRDSRRCFERYGRGRARWSGCRRSPRTWVPGRSSTPACTPAPRPPTAPPREPTPNRPVRPSGAPPCTSWSRPTCCDGRSDESG